jgi:hypothetical protein
MLGEELRRKHIKTLEACQRLVDENIVLKGRQSGVPPSASASDDSRIREELDALKNRAMKLADMCKNLELRCLTAETRGTELETELDTLRELHCCKEARLISAHELCEHSLARVTSKLSQLDATCDELQAQRDEDVKTIQSLRDENKRLASQTVEDEATQQQTLIALRSQFNHDLEILHSEIEKERSLRHAAEDKVQRTERDLAAALKATEVAVVNSSRLKAENSALELEVRRLSQLQLEASSQSANRPSLSAALTAAAEELPPPAILPGSVRRSSGSAPTADSSNSNAPPKEMFVEYAQLKRENQRLRRQIEDIKSTQAKTMNLTKRAAAGSGGLGRRGAT